MHLLVCWVEQEHSIILDRFMYLNMYPINGPEVIVTFAQDKCDANGNLVDENTQMFVRQLLQNLVNWTKKLKQ